MSTTTTAEEKITAAKGFSNDKLAFELEHIFCRDGQAPYLREAAKRLRMAMRKAHDDLEEKMGWRSRAEAAEAGLMAARADNRRLVLECESFDVARVAEKARANNYREENELLRRRYPTQSGIACGNCTAACDLFEKEDKMTENGKCPSCGMNYIDDENMEGYVDQHVCEGSTAAPRDDLLDTHCRECNDDVDGCNITTRFGWLCPNCVDSHFAASAKAYDTIMDALHVSESVLDDTSLDSLINVLELAQHETGFIGMEGSVQFLRDKFRHVRNMRNVRGMNEFGKSKMEKSKMEKLDNSGIRVEWDLKQSGGPILRVLGENDIALTVVAFCVDGVYTKGGLLPYAALGLQVVIGGAQETGARKIEYWLSKDGKFSATIGGEANGCSCLMVADGVAECCHPDVLAAQRAVKVLPTPEDEEESREQQQAYQEAVKKDWRNMTTADLMCAWRDNMSEVLVYLGFDLVQAKDMSPMEVKNTVVGIIKEIRRK